MICGQKIVYKFPKTIACFESEHSEARPKMKRALGGKIYASERGYISVTIRLSTKQNVSDYNDWLDNVESSGGNVFAVDFFYLGKDRTLLVTPADDSSFSGKAFGSKKISMKLDVLKVYDKWDDIPPVITLLGDNPQNIVGGGVYSDPGATATDNIDGDITSKIIVSDGINMGKIGNYEIRYSVTDSGHNTVSKIREVNVISINDTIAPEITIIGQNPVTVELNETYIDSGATAIDNVDGDVTANITTTSTVDTSTVGAYQTTYSVSDAAGNSASATRTVNVVDTADHTPPVITLLGDNPLTLQVGDTYVEPGATATDDVDGDVSNNIVITGTVDTSTAGTYDRYYNVSDGAGNAADEVQRTVNVEASASGSIEFSTVGTNSFTVDDNVNSLTYCGIAGGGGGYYGGVVNSGGGHAGEIGTGSISVNPGDTVTVVIGAGGLGQEGGASADTSGGDTVVSVAGVEVLRLNGGNGGTNSAGGDYPGDGQQQASNCIGQFNDGSKYTIDANNTTYNGWGGEAGLSSGINAGTHTPASAIKGAGGTGVSSATANDTGGKGGDGYMLVSWGN